MNKRFSLLRILLHGFFLISANLFSIMAAFVIVQVASAGPDKILQASIALIINVGVYVTVFKLMRGTQQEIMKIDNFSMFAVILLISLALLPAVFYPIHYLTQGYWSSFDNLLATWPFQLIVNGLCLVLNLYILRSKNA
jgi:hypothetical protein